MTFRSICFRVIETDPCKHYFKVIHDFIMQVHIRKEWHHQQSL